MTVLCIICWMVMALIAVAITVLALVGPCLEANWYTRSELRLDRVLDEAP